MYILKNTDFYHVRNATRETDVGYSVEIGREKKQKVERFRERHDVDSYEINQ